MKKTILIYLLLILTILTGCTQEEYYQSNDISRYGEYIDTLSYNSDYNFFPILESLPDSVTTEIKYLERTAFLIRSKSLTLTITLPEEEYSTFKAVHIGEFEYFYDSILDSDGEQIISDVEFDYGSYNILVVKNELFDYPKNFGMIGYSDEKHEVVFLLFSDNDIDLISDMNHFLEVNFLFME